MFVCVKRVEEGGSFGRGPSTILPSEERDRDEKQKMILGGHMHARGEKNDKWKMKVAQQDQLWQARKLRTSASAASLW